MGGCARNLYSRSRVKEPRGKTLLSYRMAANPPSTCAHPLHPLQSMSETEERLAFEVLGASSEDPNHPAQNLLQYSEDGRGWRSEQGQPTPQDLDLKFSGTIRLATLKVLAHEFLIPLKVELVVTALEGGKERSLGFVTLQCNEVSSFQARELKSIPLGDEEATLLTLRLHGFHENDLNQHGQVAIAGIEVFGRREGQCQPAGQVQTHPSTDGAAVTIAVLEDMRQRIEGIDQVKLQKARAEDFFCAARIKDVLDVAKKALARLRDRDARMNEAAVSEDYRRAARLKKERDAARAAALAYVAKAEEAVDKICKEENDIENSSVDDDDDAAADDDETDGRGSDNNIDDGGDDNDNDNDNDVSGNGIPTPSVDNISAQKAPIEETKGKITEELDQSLFHESDDAVQNDGEKLESSRSTAQQASHPPRDDINGIQDVKDDSYLSDNRTHDESDCPEKNRHFDEVNHPLKGVSNYMGLPYPEDIDNEGGETSSDTIERVEALLGEYVAKCFFSHNWNLREAALAKTSLLLPNIRQELEPSQYLRTICLMLERSIDDRVVQVFVTTLILLDDCIGEFEHGDMPNRDVLSFLSVIGPSLVTKLGDSNGKSREGTETALLSLALSPKIGPAYVVHLLVRQGTMELRAGRAIAARFRTLDALVTEFGESIANVDGIMDLVRDRGLGHKEADVREAARDVALSVAFVLGNEIDPWLQGMSGRQRREFQAMYDSGCRHRMRGGSNIPGGKFGPVEDAVGRYPQSPRCVHPEDPPVERNVTVTRRGRGRGRRRP